MREFENLEILGVAKHRGGRFGRVVIAGSGKITGDLECDSFELPGAGKVEEGNLTVHGPVVIDGAGKVEGSLRGERLEVNGSFKVGTFCEISDDLEVNGIFKVEDGFCTVGGSVEVNGSIKIEGPLTGNALKVNGTLRTEGSVTAGTVAVDGVFKAAGEVQAETFTAEGIVRIDGLLNAETVEFTVSGEDRIGSIGGGSVKVERGQNRLSLLGKRPCLSTELIEADEIHIEYTDCRTVRGVNVHIGSECVVDRVEYSGTLTTAPNASIGEKVKV